MNPESYADAASDVWEPIVRRLASMEGFTIAGVVEPENKWCQELLARIEYAREALGDF